MRALLLAALVAMLSGACGGSGIGKGVRTDIQNQMESAREPMSQCYADALTRNGDVGGTMSLSFVVAPTSGQFTNVQASRSNIGDQEMEQCVINHVSSLKLQTPQKAKVAVDRYPVRFSPSN